MNAIVQSFLLYVGTDSFVNDRFPLFHSAALCGILIEESWNEDHRIWFYTPSIGAVYCRGRRPCLTELDIYIGDYKSDTEGSVGIE